MVWRPQIVSAEMTRLSHLRARVGLETCLPSHHWASGLGQEAELASSLAILFSSSSFRCRSRARRPSICCILSAGVASSTAFLFCDQHLAGGIP